MPSYYGVKNIRKIKNTKTITKYLKTNFNVISFFKYEVMYVRLNIKTDAVNKALRKDSVGINDTAILETVTKKVLKKHKYNDSPFVVFLTPSSN